MAIDIFISFMLEQLPSLPPPLLLLAADLNSSNLTGLVFRSKERNFDDFVVD